MQGDTPPPSATWAATTKSLNWAATAKSLNCYRQRGTLGLSEAAASRQTGQSERVGSEAVAQALHRRCARVVELHGGRLRT